MFEGIGYKKTRYKQISSYRAKYFINSYKNKKNILYIYVKTRVTV